MSIYDMIYNGQFGTNNPNPYQNQQQQFTYAPMPQQNIVGIGNNVNMGMGYNSYNPNANYGQYTNVYGYNNSRFSNPTQHRKMVMDGVNMKKNTHRRILESRGIKVDEELLDRLYNPYNQSNMAPNYKLDPEFCNSVAIINSISNTNQQYSLSNIAANYVNTIMSSVNKACDGVNSDDVRGIINSYRNVESAFDRMNITLYADSPRSLSRTYNSGAYNQLLQLHSSNQPAYVQNLMYNGRYDNNKDDLPLGMQHALNVARERNNISAVTSDEIQHNRQRWLNAIASQMIG